MRPFVEASPWRAGVIVGEERCPFAPVGWLHEIADAKGDARSPLSLTVELRRGVGGMLPRALVGARFEPSNGESVELLVGHTGDGARGQSPICVGPLQWNLFSGLPLEFARGVMAGLVACDSSLPSGRLTVSAGGYDRVDSSFYIFDRAARLVRALLAEALLSKPVTDEAVIEALERLPR